MPESCWFAQGGRRSPEQSKSRSASFLWTPSKLRSLCSRLCYACRNNTCARYRAATIGSGPMFKRLSLQLEQIPRLPQIPRQHGRSVACAGEVFLLGVPMQFLSSLHGNVAEQCHRRPAMAYLDIRVWSLARPHALDKIERVGLGR